MTPLHADVSAFVRIVCWFNSLFVFHIFHLDHLTISYIILHPLYPTIPTLQGCCAHLVACPCLTVPDLRLVGDWQEPRRGQQVRSSKGQRCGGAPNPTRRNLFPSRRSWWKQKNLLLLIDLPEALTEKSLKELGPSRSPRTRGYQSFMSQLKWPRLA